MSDLALTLDENAQKPSVNYKDITGNIIDAAFTIYHACGYGLPERDYHRALQLELLGRGFVVDVQEQKFAYTEKDRTSLNRIAH